MVLIIALAQCLITSQNATAPKLGIAGRFWRCRLITSQNATAPKLDGLADTGTYGLITSQNATAPKHASMINGNGSV